MTEDELDKAIDEFCQAIALDPNDAAAYTNRGDAYRHRQPPSRRA